MRVPRSWLREIVDVDAPTDELAIKLSTAGVAVDRVERFAAGVSGIFVGRVLDVEDVPESDKLVVANVDVGAKGKVQVLAGAKNFSAGDRVPVAMPGARVTTLNGAVGVRKMLGKYESNGMLCSAKELGISEDHSGILVLGDDAPVGEDVTAMLGLDDEVLEFEIYPNRPDLMSVVGIAREVALLYDVPMNLPDATVTESRKSAESLTSVTIDDQQACPRYLARIIEDVSFGPSPWLVQARLNACGFRPLGNLIDATNYVLLLTGQPLHAFDLDKLAEERIVVRKARPGEKIKTIDEDDRTLDGTDLVIADAEDAQAIAGVMGGAQSEVGPDTKRVLLESAYFHPLTVSRTARRLHMHTEASSRFERGCDPQQVPTAAAIAAELMRTWAAGTVAKGAVDAGTAPKERRLFLRPERAEAILGVRVAEDEMQRWFSALGCRVTHADARLAVLPPSWRPDLEREVDLIEEIARLYGYERIPARHRAGYRGGRSNVQVLRERVRQALLGSGLFEATLPSFVSEEDLRAFGYEGEVVRLSNPMTADQRQLRPSLIPGLMRAAQRNIDHGVRSVRLFEFGKIFTGWGAGKTLPEESEHVAVVLAGPVGGDEWYADERAFDPFDVKGILELALNEIGIRDFEIESGLGMPFHPGRSARITCDGAYLGRFGEIRPTVARAFGIDASVVAGGLALDAVLALAPDRLTISELPTQPPVLRDIAMAVSDDVAAGDIENTIRESAGETLESVTLVDTYRGPQLGEGRRSLAFRLVFRAPDRTLTSGEVDTARDAVASACRDRHGADIR